MKSVVGRFILCLISLLLLVDYYATNLVYKNEAKYWRAIKQVQGYLLKAQGFNPNLNKNQLLEIISYDKSKIFHPDSILDDAYCLREKRDSVRNSYRRNFFLIDRTLSSNHDDHRKNLKFLTISNEGKTKINKTFLSKMSLFQQSISMHLHQMHLKTLHQELLNQYKRNLYFKNATDKCLSDLNILPRAYLLTDKTQCEEYFKEQNNASDDYQYILKTNSHKGQGLRYVDQNLHQYLQRLYQGGGLCGSIQEKKIIQEITKRPILLKGRKIDIRIWILIVSKDPLIVYVYDSMLVISCLDHFDEQNLTEENFICNGAVIKKYLHDRENITAENKVIEDKFTVDDIHLDWSLQRLNQYFMRLNLTSDPLWWKRKLLPQIKSKVAYFLHINMPRNYNDPRIVGVFAMDASINESGDIRILDFNTGPNLLGYSKYSLRLLIRMNVQIVRLLKEFQRERFTRIRLLLHKIIMNKSQKLSQKEILNTFAYQGSELAPYLHNFHLIDLTQAFKNCRQFDKTLL